MASGFRCIAERLPGRAQFARQDAWKPLERGPHWPAAGPHPIASPVVKTIIALVSFARTPLYEISAKIMLVDRYLEARSARIAPASSRRA